VFFGVNLFRPEAHDRIDPTFSVMSMTRQRVQRFLSRFTREKRSDQTARAQSVGRAAALQPLVASISRSWCGGLKTRHTTFFCAEREAPLSVSKLKCLHLTRSFSGKTSVPPNPSLKLTRYGMQRKLGVRRLRHLRTPGLHCTPTRAA
jgi:hypothetical protein